ncbi:MAG: DEAD/DEAH box helicase [Planctomycetes bacterium]|nr:DEAD/DEAH box helicase [Planctomycetota bacterium]
MVGTLSFGRGRFILELEPHVMMRAKRIFSQVSKRQQGRLSLSATPAVARDIEWFAERYPLAMDSEDAARLDHLARKHEVAMAAVQSVLERSCEPPTFDLAIPARAYQRAAADLVLKTGRLLVGDDVGLGKTATAICVLSEQRARPAVVVTLTHLTGQWRAEIARFAPQLHVLVPKKGTPQPRDLEALTGLIRPDVVVLNYHKLAGWADALVKVFGARCVVFDEVQELRTGTASSKGAAAELIANKCEFRVGLSATPVFNYGGEIRTILQYLEPGCLGTVEEFSTEWCSGWGDEKIKEPKALGSHLRERGLLLRRTSADVVDEVPELAKPIRIPHLVDSDTETIERAQSSAAEFARIVLAATATGIERMQASSEIDWRLRQATGIAKAPYVAAFVRMLLEESEERVLLFGWHKAVYALWRDALKQFLPVFFTGDETAAEKDHAKREFLEGKSRVLVMSLRAGAGLDGLQEKCRCVVFGELDWSPGVHEQCIGRVHRPGQPDAVRAFFLHSDSGSDPLIVEVLGIKRAQAEGIRDPLASGVEEVVDTTERIRRLAESCLRRAASREQQELSA